MATKWDNYGGKTDVIEMKPGKTKAFNGVSGGDVNPYGDVVKGDNGSAMMNAGEAFNQKSITKVDAMGTDAPTKTNAQTGSRMGKLTKDKNHFDVDYNVEPMGTVCADNGGHSNRK